MSVVEAERLLNDLHSNADLKNTLKAAGSDGFESAAKEAGYDVTRHDFADAIKAQVVRADLAGPRGFELADGVVSGISSGISSHVSGVGSGIA
tara:strand:- start:9417 stop:9695 length:279 start_codon:yes stop_codon:yes gene_type:complete